jgi:N-terminal acetyltransferase B complex non-catalytic subunit
MCSVWMLPYLTTTTTSPSPISKVLKHHASKNSAASSRVPQYVHPSIIPECYTDMTQESRYRENLLAEKIMLIVDSSPLLSGEKDMLQQSLKRHLDSQKQDLDTKVGAKTMTRSEQLAAYAYHAMASFLLESCDKELWTEGDFKPRLESLGLELCKRIREQTELIGSLQYVVPAFQSTLNAIYSAYEVGRTALYFCKYLAGKGKAVHESQAEANKNITEDAEKLVQDVIQKCAVIKKGLDEGGWIDKVLESVFPEMQAGLDHGLSVSLMEAVKEVPDEDFMEEWAGEVVESWKDSIAGFSYIKMPRKA